MVRKKEQENRKKEKQEMMARKEQEKREKEKQEMKEKKEKEEEERIARKEQLYEKVNTAILDEQYSSMVDILQQPGYKPDAVGGEDAQTALHVAVQCEYVEAINILLEQINVDCNVQDSDGLSPLMLAASKVKIDALERLLEDPRVNIKLRTKRNENALDLLPIQAFESQRLRAMTAFQAAKNRTSSEAQKKRKVAILIANYSSENSAKWDPTKYKLGNLAGAKEDLEELTDFLGSQYTVRQIANAEDIGEEIGAVMKALPDSCKPVTHLQIVYSGMVRS